MTQLIPQQKIDEAASDYADVNYDEDYRNFYDVCETAFNAGVQFALKEIEPLICEFAEWAYKNYDYIERIGNKSEWIWKKNNDCFTTKQLLEEFINSKNK